MKLITMILFTAVTFFNKRENNRQEEPKFKDQLNLTQGQAVSNNMPTDSTLSTDLHSCSNRGKKH